MDAKRTFDQHRTPILAAEAHRRRSFFRTPRRRRHLGVLRYPRFRLRIHRTPPRSARSRQQRRASLCSPREAPRGPRDRAGAFRQARRRHRREGPGRRRPPAQRGPAFACARASRRPSAASLTMAAGAACTARVVARELRASAAARRVRSGHDGRRIDSATISTRPPPARVPASFPASHAKSKAITGALAMNTRRRARAHARRADHFQNPRASTNPSRSSFVALSASPSATNDRISASAMTSIARASDTARSFGNSTVRASAANASSSSPPRRNGTRKDGGPAGRRLRHRQHHPRHRWNVSASSK